MPQKQPDLLENIYPKSDKLSGRQVDYLLRSATFICSTYAYHRKVLPHTAFKFTRIGQAKNHTVFDSSHPKAKLHRDAIQNISAAVEEKKINQFIFGICKENDPEKVVEALKFDFDYGEAAMNVLLPNATNVRISSKWDFADDLCEVLKRVRLVAVYLSALPTGIKSFVMVQYKKQPQNLPKNFAYHNDYDFRRLKTLPLARFPCDTHNTVMTVEIRSEYFEVSEDDIRKDIERDLGVEEEDDSDSNDSTPPPSNTPPKSRDPSPESSGSDIVVVEDSLEKARAEKPTDNEDVNRFDRDLSDDQIMKEVDPDIQDTPVISPVRISRKRSYSSASFVVDSLRIEPVDVVINQLFCYNFTPLDTFKIPYDALAGWP